MKTIEIKKPEEILKQTIPGLEYSFQFNNRSDIIKAMQAYAKQQQEIAVEKALEIVFKNEELIFEMDKYDQYILGINKQSILSLKPEILKELEK